VLRKQNICTTLSFISVLITAIGYCGDQSDNEENEQQQTTTEVVSDIPEVVRTNTKLEIRKKEILFSLQLCCVLRDMNPILHMVLKQYADDTEVTEVRY
jgi:hypothetical protein